MDSHSKFRARCVEASTDKAVGVIQVCVRKKVCSEECSPVLCVCQSSQGALFFSNQWLYFQFYL